MSQVEGTEGVLVKLNRLLLIFNTPPSSEFDALLESWIYARFNINSVKLGGTEGVLVTSRFTAVILRVFTVINQTLGEKNILITHHIYKATVCEFQL